MKYEKKVFVGSTIIDGTGREPLENAILLTEGSKIAAVGERGEVTIPEDAKILDVKGKTLIPGLIDAHVHFSGGRPGEGRTRWSIGEPWRAIRAAIDARKMLYMGYTGARDCGGTIGPFLKGAIEEGTMPGPRIMAAGPSINNTYGHIGTNPMPVKLANAIGRHFVDGIPECLKAVRTNLREGADFIKIASGLKGESRKFPIGMSTYSFDEIKAICDEAHRNYTIVASHCCSKEGIITSLKAGLDTIEHGTEFDEECANLTLKLDKILCPTAAISIKRPGVPAYSDEIRLYFNKGVQTRVQIAHEKGVKIASSSDFSGGDHLGGAAMGKNAFDLQRLVECGLAPLDAIVSATKIGAEAMMMGDQIGTLETGKLADLVVVNGNPLEDITMLQEENRISMVLKGGEIVIKRS